MEYDGGRGYGVSSAGDSINEAGAADVCLQERIRPNKIILRGLWREQTNYLHHLSPDPGLRIITCPLPAGMISDDDRAAVLKVVGEIKLENMKYDLEPQIKKLLKQKDYSGLFGVYMQNGLSCFALDLAEKKLPEKRDEVMEKFPDLEGRVNGLLVEGMKIAKKILPENRIDYQGK